MLTLEQQAAASEDVLTVRNLTMALGRSGVR